MNDGPPLILSLETSGSCTAVALTRGGVQDGQALASLSLNSNITHSRRLLTAIDWILAETDCGWPDVGAVAVSIGPGSFTGLRIGLATAKGLAMAANKPLVGVSTLDALALNCSGERLVCSSLDARKKEVYACLYRSDAQGVPRRSSAIRVLDPATLAREVAEPVVFVGDAVPVYGGLWRELLGTKFHCAPPSLHTPDAAALGFLAAEILEKNESLGLDTAAPLYVRASDAELSLGKRRAVSDVVQRLP